MQIFERGKANFGAKEIKTERKMTTENNKIIAEFMGDLKEKTLQYRSKVLILDEEHKFYNSIVEVYTIEKDNTVSVYCPDGSNRWVDLDKIKNLDFNFPNRYHLDWNLLMEVVEKCYKTNSDYQLHKNIEDSFIYMVENRIEAVYNACVEFIKWYNDSVANLENK